MSFNIRIGIIAIIVAPKKSQTSAEVFRDMHTMASHWPQRKRPSSAPFLDRDLSFDPRSNHHFPHFKNNNIAALRSITEHVLRWLIPAGYPVFGPSRYAAKRNLHKVLQDDYSTQLDLANESRISHNLIELVAEGHASTSASYSCNARCP